MSPARSDLYYHIVFTTERRQRWLTEEVAKELYAYLGGIVRCHGGALLAAGGIEDHCHLLPKMPPTANVSALIKAMKGGSSRWLKERFPFLFHFSWAEGYAAFTVSPRDVDAVKAYIERQREHHATCSVEHEAKRLNARAK